jgi:acyl-coenzyme A thioesterase PaaI-like protein
MTNTRDEPAAPLAPASDHHCFGCGALNVHGLQLRLVPDPDGDGAMARFVPSRRTEGYTGVVHGGIISTVLDEVMAWSLYRHGIWAVTGQMTTRYRQPVRLNESTTATGRLVRARGKVIDMCGELRRDADGTLLAEATAMFVRVPEDQARAWQERYGVVPGTEEQHA